VSGQKSEEKEEGRKKEHEVKKGVRVLLNRKRAQGKEEH
jgi:hypothetical protein